MAKKFIIFLFIFWGVISCSTSKSGSKELDKRNAQTYYAHGTRHLVNKEYTKALDFLIKAHSFDQKDPLIHNNLAMSYYFKGQVTKALSHLNRAIDLKDSNSEARNNLASIYFQNGQLNKAEILYREILNAVSYTHLTLPTTPYV